MPQFLPLFLPSPLLDFIPKDQVKKDFAVVKNYFEGGECEEVEEILVRQNDKWKKYLGNLEAPRHLPLFNTADKIPNEETIILREIAKGNSLANELKLISDMIMIAQRKLPLPFLEQQKEKYAEWRAIPNPAIEPQLDWVVNNALAEIYFPQEFFNSKIFTLEADYSSFKYDFLLSLLGPIQLYIWYQIFIKKGPDHFFKNIQDIIINRYKIQKTFSMSAYGLLNFFMSAGIDDYGCNRFFTRRMKDNIDRELSDYCSLVNNIGEQYEVDSFKNFFFSDPWSSCNIRDPFQKTYHSEPNLVEQAIFNHLIGNYSASVNLLFPLIEGICWDISVAEHIVNKGIYTADSDLTTRNLKKRRLLDEAGAPIQVCYSAPTLKDLMEKTRMKKIFNTDFLSWICSELFPEERNPILHGVTLDYNFPFQSARLLLVLEYLFKLIKEKGYRYPDQLDPPNYWTPEKSKG